MAAKDVVVGVFFLLQVTVGILGNFYLFYHYLFLYFTGYRLKSTDLIIKHLTIANSLYLLLRGVPMTMATLKLRFFLSDFECRLFFYIQRVGRGMSCGTTCLLSVFQAITISPGHLRLGSIKAKASKYTGTSIFLCWIIYFLVNILFPMNMAGKRGDKNVTNMKDFGYCSAINSDKMRRSLYTALLSFPDILCLGIMPWSSGSMVVILYRHTKRVHYLHTNSVSSRATKTILLLVTIFVSFYFLSFLLQLFLSLLSKPSGLMVNIYVLISGGFPTVSPFILMNRDSRVFRCSLTWTQTPFPHQKYVNCVLVQ